jgi:N-acetylglutamate synthase/N-acetylornithine aminotransferase
MSIGAYDTINTPVCYGLQLSIAASCLVAHLQDEFDTIIVDQYLSQSDLLFILSAGGVYTGSLGST